MLVYARASRQTCPYRAACRCRRGRADRMNAAVTGPQRLDDGRSAPRVVVKPARVAATIGLLFALPLVVFYLWFCLVIKGGQLALPSKEMLQWLPAPTGESIAIVAGWLTFQALLQLAGPGRLVEGPR